MKWSQRVRRRENRSKHTEVGNHKVYAETQGSVFMEQKAKKEMTLKEMKLPRALTLC